MVIDLVHTDQVDLTAFEIDCILFYFLSILHPNSMVYTGGSCRYKYCYFTLSLSLCLSLSLSLSLEQERDDSVSFLLCQLVLAESFA